LRALREESGLSQNEVAQWLSARCKPIKSKAISSWERGGSSPNAEQLLHLCDLYDVSDVRVTFLGKTGTLNELGIRKLQEYASLLLESRRYSYAPLATQSVEPPLRQPLRILRLFDIPASAGTGQFLDSDSYELVEVDSGVPPSADFGVRISGDSMAPLFTDREIVWVHEQPTIEDGETGVFSYEGESFIKMFKRDKDGIRLVSANKEYGDIFISDADVFRVFGKVVC
jgi:transcriptional regulator with XRE-family HTH domain